MCVRVRVRVCVCMRACVRVCASDGVGVYASEGIGMYILASMCTCWWVCRNGRVTLSPPPLRYPGSTGELSVGPALQGRLSALPHSHRHPLPGRPHSQLVHMHSPPLSVLCLTHCARTCMYMNKSGTCCMMVLWF